LKAPPTQGLWARMAHFSLDSGRNAERRGGKKEAARVTTAFEICRRKRNMT
jgi:hypothetical protein